MKRALGFMNKPGIFQSTWKTDNAGTSASNQIELPLLSGGTYNFWIDWGDGITTNVTSYSQRTHTYASAGTYTVRATGAVGIWQFANGGDKLKILTISSWGKLKLGLYSFYGCSNLTLSGINDIPDLSTVTSLSFLFTGCSKITTIGRLNEWNTINITNFNNCFGQCTLFNQDLGNWKVDNATVLQDMFSYAPAFNNGGTSSMSSWNVSNVTTFLNMFFGATSFNNGYLSGVANQLPWNTSACTSMANMFYGATAFNSNLGTGTTPWDVSKVTSFASMFNGASNFNNGDNSAPINTWSVKTTISSNINMSSMFQSATVFDRNIGSWNVSQVTNFTNFMFGKTPATYSSANLDAIYNGWIVNGVQPNTSGTTNISFGSAKHTAAGTAGRLTLTSAPNLWIITDGGL